MLVFYGDDSGSTKKSDVCLVAGYLATSSDWIYDLEFLWHRELARAPSIRYFKAFDCKTLKNEFDGWADEEARLKLDALVAIIAQRGGTMMEFSSSILWGDFESSVTGGLRSVYPHPYYFCIHGVVSLIAKEYLTAVPHVRERIAYVFDEQNQYQAVMEQQYQHVRETVHPHIAATMGSIDFRDDRTCAPLQMADLGAVRGVINETDQGYHRLAVGILSRLRATIGGTKRAQWNPQKLKGLCGQIDAGLRDKTFW
jgi:hypothetical protein